MLKTDAYMKRDIKNILTNGFVDENPRPKYEDGTPAHTLSVNHVVREYDLSKGEFPILTLRPISWKTGIREIFTIYQKPTNVISEMEKMGCKWWSPWNIGDGTIGNRYGHTVSRYDLINRLINDIKSDPYGRRHIVDLWQYEELDSSDGLAPCAFLTIWNVRKPNYYSQIMNDINERETEEYLDMTLIQRSGDMLTASGAGSMNEVQYASLLMMIARHCGYKVGKFTHFVANEQIYDRHIKQAQIVLNRKNESNKVPKLILNPNATNFFEMTIDDFEMVDYEPINEQIELPLGI